MRLTCWWLGGRALGSSLQHRWTHSTRRSMLNGINPAGVLNSQCITVCRTLWSLSAFSWHKPLLTLVSPSLLLQGLGGSTGVALPDMPAWLAANAAATWDCSLGADMAAAVRAAAKAQLGLTVSVGVAPNKLLAKLASRAAKPDGVHVVGGVEAVQQLLAATPVDRLPGEMRVPACG